MTIIWGGAIVGDIACVAGTQAERMGCTPKARQEDLETVFRIVQRTREWMDDKDHPKNRSACSGMAVDEAKPAVAAHRLMR